MDEKLEEDRRRAVIETLNAAERLFAATAGAVEELRAELEAAADRRAEWRRARKEGRDWFGLRIERRKNRLGRRMERLLKELDLPTRHEVEALNQRLDELNARLDRLNTM
ncbi:MAG: phasin family protein [Ardenticatenaceae bacterium]|nr:phasin family protein [Ardenticatenaceae bacterium]